VELWRAIVHRRRIAAAVLAAALIPALSGCFNGYNALTTSQQEGGQVASANIGDIQIRGLVWVRDMAAPQNLTMSASFILSSPEPDELVAVTTVPNTFAVGITNGRLLLEPGSENRVGYNSANFVNLYGNIAEPSAFISTTLKFKRAGQVTVPVLIVPNTGNYEGIRPNPPALLTTPTPVPGEATTAPTAPANPTTAAATPAASAPAG
jgi:hypothetical protein